jgi:serine/threonine protein kinase
MADVNELIGGYKLARILQTSQYTQVFEVIEPHSGRHFAMKLLLPEVAGDRDHRSALFHEAEVGQKLVHDNVVRIFKVSKDEHTPHFIMEYFPSGALRLKLQAKDFNFIKEHHQKIFKQLATGLAYMNAMGYVHRDVKPDNVLVNALGDTKLIDFAITKKPQTGFLAKLLKRKGKPQGTPSYMSPEQIKDEPLDGRSDIYSYGATLFELTTGRQPFRGATMQDLLSKHLATKPDSPCVYNKDLTDDFGAFVIKLLAKKKEDRPKTFHDVLMSLQNIRVWKPPSKPGSQKEDVGR